MIEVKCPKCKEEMQFPYMICPDCKWKAKGQSVVDHSHLAETYISEHPDNADQLRYVLDMVMKEKIEESEKEVQRSRKNAEMGKKIKIWHILLTGFVGTFWIFFGIIFLFVASEEDPIPINGTICLLNIVSMVMMLVSVVLLILKLISLKDR